MHIHKVKKPVLFLLLKIYAKIISCAHFLIKKVKQIFVSFNIKLSLIKIPYCLPPSYLYDEKLPVKVFAGNVNCAI